MQIHISTTDGAPIYLQIVNQVKYLAASGRLAPGDELPPIRALAEQLIVNPNTVARAYRELAASGVITTRRGSGARVAEGGSPLARAEQKKLLAERADMLLAEARGMKIGLEEVIEIVRDREEQMRKGRDSHE